MCDILWSSLYLWFCKNILELKIILKCVGKCREYWSVLHYKYKIYILNFACIDCYKNFIDIFLYEIEFISAVVLFKKLTLGFFFLKKAKWDW